MYAARISVLALLLLPVLCTASAAQTDDENRPGAKRPGFTLAVDVGGIHYDLDDQVTDQFLAQGIDLSTDGGGGGLVFGYSWRNEFALELAVFGAGLGTGRSGVEAGIGQFEVGFRVPLLTRHRVAPYLSGHLGGTALGLSGDAVEDTAVVGGSTGIGTGIEVHLGRRWAVDFGYRFSLVNFGEGEVELADGSEQTIDLDGTGRVHRWAVRTTFSF